MTLATGLVPALRLHWLVQPSPFSVFSTVMALAMGLVPAMRVHGLVDPSPFSGHGTGTESLLIVTTLPIFGTESAQAPVAGFGSLTWTRTRAATMR